MKMTLSQALAKVREMNDAHGIKRGDYHFYLANYSGKKNRWIFERPEKGVKYTDISEDHRKFLSLAHEIIPDPAPKEPQPEPKYRLKSEFVSDFEEIHGGHDYDYDTLRKRGLLKSGIERFFDKIEPRDPREVLVEWTLEQVTRYPRKWDAKKMIETFDNEK